MSFFSLTFFILRQGHLRLTFFLQSSGGEQFPAWHCRGHRWPQESWGVGRRGGEGRGGEGRGGEGRGGEGRGGEGRGGEGEERRGEERRGEERGGEGRGGGRRGEVQTASGN